MKIIFILLISLLYTYAKAQVIDSIFIAKHTYKDLDAALKNPSDVYGLDLSRNNIKNNEYLLKIAVLKNLRQLNLSSSAISFEVFREICNLSQLEILDLAAANVDVLPSEIKKLKKLEILNLFNNNLKIIPPEIGKLKNLKMLYLSENQLVVLPPQIGNLSKLILLDLHKNKLNVLPEEIGKLRNLEKIYLFFNDLQTLPNSIGKLKKVRELNLYGLKITKLPNSIGNITGLLFLNLSTIPIEKLPDEISKLSLVELGLIYCHKLDFDDVFTKITKIKTLRLLSLAENKLQFLPASIKNLKELTNLDLSYNQLVLSLEIGNLKNLKILNLEGNKLNSLLEEMNTLAKLETLNLANNPFTTIPTSLFPFLERLDYGHSEEIKKLIKK